MINVDSVAVIPCYNVEKFCKRVIEETLGYVSRIILVDDGSNDHTGEILLQLQTNHPEAIDIITFQQNQGKGFALLSGFEKAISDYQFRALVTLDSDAQHAPNNIQELMQAVHNGMDLVIGSRDFELMPIKSRIANKIITFLLRCIFPKAPMDTQSGFRCFSYSLLTDIAEKVSGGRYEMEFRCLLLALKEKKKIQEISIPTVYIQKNRFTHFSPFRDSIRIIRVLILFLVGKL